MISREAIKSAYDTLNRNVSTLSVTDDGVVHWRPAADAEPVALTDDQITHLIEVTYHDVTERVMNGEKASTGDFETPGVTTPIEITAIADILAFLRVAEMIDRKITD